MLKLRSFTPELKTREETKDGPALSGYGFQFSEVTEDGCYGKEQFSPDVKIDFPSKCFLLRDHDRSKVLARRGKNLSIDKNSKGLFFECSKLPDTPLAKETRELIRQGIVEDVSVGFADLDSEIKDGVRTYNHIKLFEISVLPYGYFESGQVEARESKEKPPLPPELILL